MKHDGTLVWDAGSVIHPCDFCGLANRNRHKQIIVKGKPVFDVIYCPLALCMAKAKMVLRFRMRREVARGI